MSEELKAEKLRMLVDHKEEIIHKLKIENDDLLEQVKQINGVLGESTRQRDMLLEKLEYAKATLNALKSDDNRLVIEFALFEIDKIGGKK